MSLLQVSRTERGLPRGNNRTAGVNPGRAGHRAWCVCVCARGAESHSLSRFSLPLFLEPFPSSLLPFRLFVRSCLLFMFSSKLFIDICFSSLNIFSFFFFFLPPNDRFRFLTTWCGITGNRQWNKVVHREGKREGTTECFLMEQSYCEPINQWLWLCCVFVILSHCWSWYCAPIHRPSVIFDWACCLHVGEICTAKIHSLIWNKDLSFLSAPSDLYWTLSVLLAEVGRKCQF